MSIPGYGKVVPIHFEILALIGWRLSPGGSELIKSEPERIEQMRTGHADLVQSTGQDFGYDLRKWRSHLIKTDEKHGYCHPYAFTTVDRTVTSAISDPDFARLAALAKVGSEAWDREYRAKRDADAQNRMNITAARDALITASVCSTCGKPCPTYRRTCKHCGEPVKRPG